ncbi:MAG: STAS domain-containing protein [Actinomycetota bacterium]|nr:STAS domain-containing protein [Actinomycetota bacterium]
MGAPLEIEVDDVQGSSVLRLRGELDLMGVDPLERALAAAQVTGSRKVVIDLRGLTFIDSSGLSVLLRAHSSGRNGAPRLELIPGNPTIHRVFQIASLTEKLTWIDDDPTNDEQTDLVT